MLEAEDIIYVATNVRNPVADQNIVFNINHLSMVLISKKYLGL